MKKGYKKLLVFSGTIFIALLIIPVSFLHAYTIGESVFNGGDYGLKNKEFEKYNNDWIISPGSKTLSSSGRINKCWKVQSSSSTTLIYQGLNSQELQFAKGKNFGFRCYLKGTKSGDTFRARIKYRYYYYRYIDGPFLNIKKMDTQYQNKYITGIRIKEYITKYAYGNWEEISDAYNKPWVMTSVMKKLPSTTVSMSVEIQIKNTDGHSLCVYLDDAEIAVYTYAKKTENFSYYNYFTGKVDSVKIRYGVSATIFEQESLSGDHSFNQMTLAIDAFGEGSCLEKIELKIEMLPKKLHHGVWLNPFDNDYYYTNQIGDLNILSLNGFDNRISRTSQPVQDFSFMTLKFSFQVLCAATTSLVTGNPVAGVVSGYYAGILSDGITRTMFGIKKPVTDKLDANGGKDYYTKTTWNLKYEFYMGSNKVTFTPSIAQVGNFLQWTYKKGQEDISLLITGKFYWGHHEFDGYKAYYVSDGTTTSTFELEV